MITSMITPMITSSITSIIRRAVTRVLIDLDSSSFYLLSTPKVLTGDFEVSASGILNSAGGYLFADNTPTTGTARFAVQSDGAVLVASDSGNVFGAQVAEYIAILGDGKIHDFGLIRSGSDVDILLDGAVVASATSSDDFTFNSIGSQKGGTTSIPFWDNIISDSRIVDQGTPTTFRLDEATSNTENSVEGNNSLTYVNIPTSIREQFQLSSDATQWDNISPAPQELPATIEIA